MKLSEINLQWHEYLKKHISPRLQVNQIYMGFLED